MDPARARRAWACALVVLAAGLGQVPRALRNAPGAGDSLLFFDGVCNLCDGFVGFVAAHDLPQRIKFGAIQRHGDLMRSLGAADYAPGGAEALSTLVLVQGGVVYVRSDAALRTIALLDAPWNYVAVFHALPSPLRDAGYKLVEECREPTPEFESRFIEYETVAKPTWAA
ncbi:hypothetical protein M885DRAFT_560546 [Pelagophyceae sp. CCMP2097]|nr:hypothetical protein M885DRAFT_560546 [Pelagophyceae sp. CCMP2097]